MWPTIIDDGKVILFTVVTGTGRSTARIEAVTVATGRRQVVVDPGTFPLYAPSGQLMFFRNDALLAAPFAVDPLALTGPPIRVVENLAVDATGRPMAALSPAGIFAYASNGQASSRLVWVTRQGVEQAVTDTPRHYENPRLAPGGNQVVVTANGDLWIQDMTRGTFTRLTSDETAGNSFPIWTHDGKGVIFRTQVGLRLIDVDGSGRSQDIPGTTVNDYPGSVSPDGTVGIHTNHSADLR